MKIEYVFTCTHRLMLFNVLVYLYELIFNVHVYLYTGSGGIRWGIVVGGPVSFLVLRFCLLCVLKHTASRPWWWK